MKALVFKGEHLPPQDRLRLEDVPTPEIKKAYQVLIQVDLFALDEFDVRVVGGLIPGNPPIVMGRDVVGTIVAIGEEVDTNHVNVGDRVVVDPHITCPDQFSPGRQARERHRYCLPCKSGLEEHCRILKLGNTLGLDLDGGAAGLLVAPQGSCHVVPPGIEERTALLAGTTADVVRGMDQGGADERESVLILGGGPLATLFAAVVRTRGSRFAFHEENGALADRLESLVDRPELVIRTRSHAPDAATRLKDDLSILEMKLAEVDFPTQPDLVVDTTGRLADRAIGACRPGGRALLLGRDPTAPGLLIQPHDIVVQGKTVIGSTMGKGYYPRALQSLAREIDFVGRHLPEPMPMELALESGWPRIGFDPASGSSCLPRDIKLVIRPARPT